MSYYDIDAIIATHQKIDCTFKLTIPDLGYIEGNPSHAVKEGTCVSCPHWIAEMLALRDTVSLTIPNIFKTRVTNALKADPRSVSLRALNTHFHTLSLLALTLPTDDPLKQIEDLGIVLSESLRGRITLIADLAGGDTHNVGDEGVAFLKGLDELERMLFKRGHDSAKAMRDWFNRPRES